VKINVLKHLKELRAQGVKANEAAEAIIEEAEASGASADWIMIIMALLQVLLPLIFPEK